jgi:Putative transposase
VRAVRAELRRQSAGAPREGGAELAAVSFPQRFGSALNPHFHYHLLAIDGVFSEETPDEVRFPATQVVPRTALVLSPLELLEGLSRLIPPPRDRLQK